jgi:hypothetical protein
MNIQKAQDQGSQAIQKLLSDKASRDQREEQQGVTNLDLLKNCVFSSLLPIKLDLLGAYSGSTDKVFSSFLQSMNFYGVTSLYSKKKPLSFFLSLFGSVIDLDWVIEKLAHAQSEPDKYGHDYHSYQEAIQNNKPVGSEAQEKYEQSKHEQRSHQGEGGGHNDEMNKFSEGYRKMQHQNHENQNHNNHYNASNAWKSNVHIMEEISRKHESHKQYLAKVNRDIDESRHKQQRIDSSKRR